MYGSSQALFVVKMIAAYLLYCFMEKFRAGSVVILRIDILTVIKNVGSPMREEVKNYDYKSK